jgi:CHAT domain-containing protein
MRLSRLIIIFLVCGWSNISYTQDWKIYINKAGLFDKQNLTDSSLVYYIKAKEIIEKDSFWSLTLLDINKKLVKAYFNTNQAKKTAQLFIEIKNSINRNFGLQSDEYANWNDEAGLLFFNQDDYLQAKDFFLQSKSIRQQLKKEKEYTRSCNLLGNTYSNLGEYSNAEAVFLEVMPIRERLFTKQSNEYAQICNNLGDVYRKMGDYSKAEQLSLEAKEIRSHLFGSTTSLTYAISCVNLANVYRDMGQYEKAEPLYLLAKKIRQDSLGKENSLYTLSCNILADLYYYMKQNEKAESLYLEAKDIREKLFTKRSYAYAQSCNNLSALYQDMGRLNEAEALASEAKQIYLQVLPEGHPTFPINYNNLGELYHEIGNLEKAEAYYSTARKLWNKSVGKEHPYYTLTTFNLAQLYWNKNELSKAENFFKEATDAKFREIDRIFEFTNEVQKQAYLKSINGYVDDFLSFQYQNANVKKAGDAYQVSLQNRNLILSSGKDLKAAINTNTDSATKRIYQEWRAAKERIAFLYTQSTLEEKEKKEVEQKAENLEKQLVRGSLAYKQNKETITWKQIQEQLLPGEASIEFAEFNVNNGRRQTDSVLYVALLLRKDTEAPQMIPLFERKALDSLLYNTRNNGSYSLYNADSNTNNFNSQRLYTMLWKPLKNDLKGVNKIFFAPAGLLHRIAFAALPTGEGQQVLSDQYQLQQLASTADVANTQSEYLTSFNNIYVYGGILYDADSAELKKASYAFHAATPSFSSEVNRGSKWDYLEGTEKEMSLIERLAEEKKISVISKKGVVANEESFKALNGESSPSLLHIATHGFFFPDRSNEKKALLQKTETSGKPFKLSDNPLFRSGLLFAGANYAWGGKPVNAIEDGILTAYEVSNLYLPNTRLVVLSACETALGDIQGSEGVYGLQRAFKMAGVQNLIMSLWKVPDVETAEFMELFYTNLFGNKSVNDAFHLAQTRMKNKYRSEPYKWAAWILVK